MWLGIITLFPEMFTALTDYGVTGRAFRDDKAQLNLWNP
ncbi:MAG: tRNA (guanine37-N1)-methyltransferase, partial [Enterobacterales bacterium]